MLAAWRQGSMLTRCQLCSCRGDQVAMLRSWCLVPLCQGGHVKVMTSSRLVGCMTSRRPCWSHDVTALGHFELMTSGGHIEIIRSWHRTTDNDDVKVVMFVLDRRSSQQRQNYQFFSYIFFRRSIPLRNALQLWLCLVPRKDSLLSICLSEISRWCYTHLILVLAPQLIPNVLYYPLWR